MKLAHGRIKWRDNYAELHEGSSFNETMEQSADFCSQSLNVHVSQRQFRHHHARKDGRK